MTDPYEIKIGGVKADPMRICRAYGITDMGIQQAIKKLLRCGNKHKSRVQDIAEAITSLQRVQEMDGEDSLDAIPYSKCNHCQGEMKHTLTESFCVKCGYTSTMHESGWPDGDGNLIMPQ